MAIYEILIRGNPDGAVAGAHQILWEGDRPGLPRPLDPAAAGAALGSGVADLAAQLVAAKARIGELERELLETRLDRAELPVALASVTMFQTREALRLTRGPNGGSLLAAVDAYVEAHRADNPTLALAWEYAPQVERRGAFVAALAAIFGLDDAALDTLFASAAAIHA
jgi:hypothetical protein